MGRLFWKFFFFFLFAQITTILGVTIAISLEHRHALLAAEAADGDGNGASNEVSTGAPSAGGLPAGASPATPSAVSAPVVAPPAHAAQSHEDRLTAFSLEHVPLEPIIGGLIASLIFAALLAWYVSKPIRSLRSAFLAAAGGNLDVRLSSHMGGRRDELADLGREFDRTSIQLKALMEGQRRLLHEVSHELRSPLARLQMAVGLARQQPDMLESWMERIESESERMDRLVDELLTLSRVQAGVLGENAEQVDIGELLRDVTQDAQFEAGASGRNVKCSVDVVALGGAVIAGRAELLHRAVENIARNAVKHTADGGHVEIVGKKDDNRHEVRLSVLDEGPGVPDPELTAIFEPFFRGAAAKGTDGHGVGLAIARGVVEAHGGTVRAMNRATGGLCVEIVLPT